MSSAYPILAWDNKIIGATVTANSEASGSVVGPLTNLQSWKTYTRWKSDESPGFAETWLKIDAGAGQTYTATCVGIVGHNLNTAGAANIKVQSCDDDATWLDCTTAWTPADDKCQFKLFTASKTNRYFRLLIPAGYTADLEIGVLFIGPYLEFPELPESGFDPDSDDVEFESQVSQSGNHLGRFKRFANRTIKVSFRYLTDTWIVNTWIPYMLDDGDHDFIWAWDIENHPTECYLLWHTDPSIKAPFDQCYRSLDLDMEGLRE